MLNIKKHKRLAIALCLALAMTCIDIPITGTVSEAAPAAMETQTPKLPTGDLYEMKSYEVDSAAPENVSSYDNGMATYSESESLLEKGIGNYGYNSLTENEKEFYNALKTSYLAFITDASATFEKVTFSDNTTAFTPFGVSFIDAGLDATQAKKVHAAFHADCPWLFWVGGVSTWSDGRLLPTVKANYPGTPADVRNMNTTIESGIQTYINATSGAEDTYEKVRIIHDKIVDSVNYAYKEDGNTPEDSYWAHSVVGVFDTSHYNTVVCEGYAKTFALILNVLDIPNVYVSGKSDGANHAWNAVSFDGGETYYYVDATWDDWGGDDDTLIENNYIYFAMPKDTFERSHTPRTDGEGLSWQYDMPNLGTDMDYTYFVKYAAYAEDSAVTDNASAQEFLKGVKALSPNTDCVMLFQSEASRKITNNVLSLGGYYPISAYGGNMYLCSHAVNDYAPATPVSAFAFSKETLNASPSTATQTLTITSVTANSDDYITFSSSNEAVVRVKTPYVKAKDGETIELIVKKEGTATIHAKAAKGTGTATCEITVGDDAVEPSPSPSATPSAGPDTEPSASPSTAPSASPSAEPSTGPSTAPSASPSTAPSAVPGTKPSASPSTAPSAVPGTKPWASPSITPSASPGILPTVRPGITPSASPGTNPSALPDTTGTPAPDETITPSSSPTGTPSVKPSNGTGSNVPKKGDKITDSKTKASYTVTGTGKNKTVDYNKSQKKAKTIKIPDTVKINEVTYKVTSVGAKAFAKNTSLKKIIIGENVKTIGKQAFYGCKKVKNVEMGEQVTSIAKEAFYNCTSLTEITIPAKITKIGAFAFYNCKKMTEISIDTKKLTSKSIGSNAFYRVGSAHYKKTLTEVPLSKLSSYTKLLRKKGYSKKAVIMPAGGNVEAYMPAPDPVEFSKDAISLTIEKSEDGTEYGTATVKLKRMKDVQLKTISCNVKNTSIATATIKGNANVSVKVKARKKGDTTVTLTVRYQKGRKIKTKKLTLDVEVTLVRLK